MQLDMGVDTVNLIEVPWEGLENPSLMVRARIEGILLWISNVISKRISFLPAYHRF